MNQLRFIRSVIYRLKRDYGSTVDIYYDRTETVDLESGKRAVAVEKLTVRRAVPLPRRVQENPILSAAITELFRRGATVEFGDRELLVDYKDLPSRPFDIKRIAYIIYNSDRYEVITSSDYETHAVVLTLKSTTGAYRAANVEMGVKSTISVTPGAEGTT